MVFSVLPHIPLVSEAPRGSALARASGTPGDSTHPSHAQELELPLALRHTKVTEKVTGRMPLHMEKFLAFIYRKEMGE